MVALDFFKNHATSGEWVYIPFCGSGAEVEGALLAGCNVVCCDILHQMFEGTCHRMAGVTAKFAVDNWTLENHLGLVEEDDEEDEEEKEEEAEEKADDDQEEATG